MLVFQLFEGKYKIIRIVESLFLIGITPGKRSLDRIRNQMLNWLIKQVVSRDVNQYANQVWQWLDLTPFQLPYFRASFKVPTCICQFGAFLIWISQERFAQKHSLYGSRLCRTGVSLYATPPWWGDLQGSRKVILINQGTIATDIKDLIKPAVEALREENLLLIAVPVGPEQLDNLPPNVRTKKYIPFAHLLPHVDLMITNGGTGEPNSSWRTAYHW